MCEGSVFAVFCDNAMGASGARASRQRSEKNIYEVARVSRVANVTRAQVNSRLPEPKPDISLTAEYTSLCSAEADMAARHRRCCSTAITFGEAVLVGEGSA